jgi:hypothetical protein
MNAPILTSTLAVLLGASSLWPQNIYGSLVVAIVSSKGEYVVIAAESRNTSGHTHAPANDDACKIIGLDAKTLFFETGESEYRSQHGDLWDSRAVARTVYLKSRHHDPDALSLAWMSAARSWFARLPYTEMPSVTVPSAEDIRKIGTGGFVAFSAEGVPVVEGRSLYYSFEARTFSEKPEFTSPKPGQAAVSGLASGLVDEFLTLMSPRAKVARGSDFVGIDAATDARIAKNAIEFAEYLSAEPEKSQLGGPIDVAILRKRGTIEWASRKNECYREDLRTRQ